MAVFKMSLYCCLLIVSLGFVVVLTEYSGVLTCTTPNNATGACVSIFFCPSVMKIMGTLEPAALQHVHQLICCDWSFRDLMVCCEKSEISPCAANMDNTPPQVQSLSKAENVESLTQAMESVSEPANIQNITQQVENVDKPANMEIQQVQIISKAATSDDDKAHRDFVIKKLLPTRAYCGLQHTDDRFYNDTETALDEFPWLAHAIFTDEEDTLEFADRCNGALISNRYVLTSEYCARNPIKVRLGQYNTNKTISCISNPEFPECTEPTVVIDIEKEIHRQVDNSLTVYHDFALFRLAKPVLYDDFIRPICLPLDDSTKPEEQELFVFSGWGASTQTGVIKKRLTYSSTTPEECNEFRNQTDELTASENLICLTPTKDNIEPACNGEEGGPLMYSFKHQWFARGIVTKVYPEFDKDCSTTRPVDALKITPEIIEWILDNINE